MVSFPHSDQSTESPHVNIHLNCKLKSITFYFAGNQTPSHDVDLYHSISKQMFSSRQIFCAYDLSISVHLTLFLVARLSFFHFVQKRCIVSLALSGLFVPIHAA